MHFLFYRYGSVCEPDIMNGFQSLGHTIKTIEYEITNKEFPAEKMLEVVYSALLAEHFDGVFSINYYPVLSAICNIIKVPYLSWTVDSPVVELLSNTVSNPCNRIFLFDREQYWDIAPYNPDHVFYLPLATNCTRLQKLISSTPTKVHQKWFSDISFVGSLYTEKCPFDALASPPEYLLGYLHGIMDAQKKIYGYFFLDKLLSEDIIIDFIAHMPNYYIPPELSRRDDRKVIALKYLGMKVTAMERLEIMRQLGSRYPIHLYTASDTSTLPVQNCGCAKTLTEMPLIFHNSKINLNITCKSIRSGICQRIWDICGAGGFVLTNYQSEIPEYFVIGEDLDTYSSLEELEEKVTFYIAHDDIRRKIAANGFQKVNTQHNYTDRIQTMLSLAKLQL